MIALTPWVLPYKGARGIDAFGAGGFGAPRVQGGVTYGHKGLDLIADPGALVVAPCMCQIVHIGRAYPDSDLGSIHLAPVGMQDAKRYLIKLLYARCQRSLGDVLAPGEVMGMAQNVAAYHEAKEPQINGHMTNHVHGEVHWDGEPVDPGICLALSGVSA